MEQCIGALVALCLRQGITLVHFSPQPEPMLSLKAPNASRENRLR
jgi:hypothetical protein